MKISITELMIVFIVALFALGPDRLPAYARKLGEALSQFRKFSGEVAEDIKETVVEPLEEVQKPIREAVEPITEVDKAVRENVRDVKNAFAGIGKKPTKTAPQKSASMSTHANLEVSEEALPEAPETMENADADAPDARNVQETQEIDPLDIQKSGTAEMSDRDDLSSQVPTAQGS